MISGRVPSIGTLKVVSIRCAGTTMGASAPKAHRLLHQKLGRAFIWPTSTFNTRFNVSLRQRGASGFLPTLTYRKDTIHLEQSALLGELEHCHHDSPVCYLAGLVWIARVRLMIGSRKRRILFLAATSLMLVAGVVG